MIVTITTIIAVILCQLGDYSVKNLEERLAKSTSAKVLSRYVDYKANAPRDIFIANTNFWARGIDFSCVSPWNSKSGSLRGGTLISPRHIVCSAHFPLIIGTRILFVNDADGGVCPCYLEKKKVVKGTDIMIGLLNAEVTPNIKPAKILPDNYELFLDEKGFGMPVATFNQNEELFLTESNVIFSDNTNGRILGSHQPSRKSFKGFRSKIIVGDSANPAFLIIGNKPVLLYCLQYGGCGSGPALHLYKREIQMAMDDLCPGYRLDIYQFEK